MTRPNAFIVVGPVAYLAALALGAGVGGCGGDVKVSTAGPATKPAVATDAGSPGITSDAGSAGPTTGSNLGGGSRGCDQGTSCMPGNDLAAPAPEEGFQVATPAGAITVQPGEEQFLCFYKTLPNTTEVDVGAFVAWLSPASSHHVIVYQETQGGAFGAQMQPDGTLNSCTFAGGTWLYASNTPGELIRLDLPSGVGLPMQPGTQIMLNMHFINTTSAPLNPQVKFNLMYTKNIQYKAAAMVSFNTKINVPPGTESAPGTQTVSGTCTPPVGAQFFDMSTHTHKHATLAEVNFVSGGTTTNIVHTTDWEHPDTAIWQSPNFLTVKQGDTFTYSCSYSNTSSSAVTVGNTAATNEMCMAIGYYFPAGNAACR
jgi:hypothetical protein